MDIPLQSKKNSFSKISIIIIFWSYPEYSISVYLCRTCRVTIFANNRDNRWQHQQHIPRHLNMIIQQEYTQSQTQMFQYTSHKQHQTNWSESQPAGPPPSVSQSLNEILNLTLRKIAIKELKLSLNIPCVNFIASKW